MYLLIFEDGTLGQKDGVTEDDFKCVQAGILDVVKIFDGKFEQLDHSGNGNEWVEIETVTGL